MLPAPFYWVKWNQKSLCSYLKPHLGRPRRTFYFPMGVGREQCQKHFVENYRRIVSVYVLAISYDFFPVNFQLSLVYSRTSNFCDSFSKSLKLNLFFNQVKHMKIANKFSIWETIFKRCILSIWGEPKYYTLS